MNSCTETQSSAFEQWLAVKKAIELDNEEGAKEYDTVTGWGVSMFVYIYVYMNKLCMCVCFFPCIQHHACEICISMRVHAVHACNKLAGKNL